MELKDFVKELAVNLDRSNVDEYKQRASALVMDVDSLSGEELAEMVNTNRSYDSALRNIFNSDEKALHTAVKKIMKETDFFLSFAVEFYMKNKRSFGWLNKITQDWLANPSHMDIDLMTYKVLTHWLDNPKAQIYLDKTTGNDFYKVVEQGNKKTINFVISHNNFKNVASHYPLRELLIGDTNHNILTKKSFDKVFTRMMEIINDGSGWNPDVVANELAPLIVSKHIQIKHIGMLSTEQEIMMYEYAMRNNIKLSTEIMKYFFEITGDEELLPDEAKDVFLF